MLNLVLASLIWIGSQSGQAQPPGTPPAPPDPVRNGSAPEYDAKCRTVNGKGDSFWLRLQVRGNGTSRQGMVRSSTLAHRALGRPPSLTTFSMQEWGGRWSQTDTVLFGV